MTLVAKEPAGQIHLGQCRPDAEPLAAADATQAFQPAAQHLASNGCAFAQQFGRVAPLSSKAVRRRAFQTVAGQFREH